MRRRSLLASVGLTALAGCATGDRNEPSPTATATDSSGSTSDPSDGDGSPAAFEFVGVEAPESVPLNSELGFAIGVENTGGTAGTFTSGLEARTGDDDWQSVGTVEMELSAGEVGEWRSPRFVVQYLATRHYRLAAFDETWTIEVTPRDLDFGTYYQVPTGFLLAVLGGSFESSYPAEGDDTTQSPSTPSDGEEWLIVRLEVRNAAERSRTPPPAASFVAEVGDERYTHRTDVSDDPYDDSSLGGETVRRGDLVYAVPEGTRASDVAITWDRSLPDGDVAAAWTQGD